LIINKAAKKLDRQQFFPLKAGLADLSGEQIEAVRAKALAQKCSLREAIIRLGFLSEDRLLAAVAKKENWSWVDLATDFEMDREALGALGAQVTRPARCGKIRPTPSRPGVFHSYVDNKAE
jgi:hypothetical protein